LATFFHKKNKAKNAFANPVILPQWRMLI